MRTLVVAIPQIEGKCFEKFQKACEPLRFLVVIVTWFHGAGGLPHQSADWFAMTGNFEAKPFKHQFSVPAAFAQSEPRNIIPDKIVLEFSKKVCYNTLTVQGSYIGNTTASQAVKAGSTPVPCSIGNVAFVFRTDATFFRGFCEKSASAGIFRQMRIPAYFRILSTSRRTPAESLL